MHWPSLQKIAISLPMAMLAALTLIGINEAGFQRSHDALEHLAHSQTTHASVNRLLQSMLDAETGNRGYLLTGEESYLEPYEAAVSTVNENLTQLRTLVLGSAEDLEDFSQLSRQISRKLSEMELSLRLRRKGQEDAWKFVLSTDVGKQNMDAIRTHARALIARSTQKVGSSQTEISQSLQLSRLGIALMTAVGLLAFYMYLRQSNALQRANEREQVLLEQERARLEGLVRERTASLNELANHLQQVREEERGYLARELHDELGALLTAAKLDVARLKSRITSEAPEVAERLKHLSETLNSVIALKRRIIEDLRPSSLSHLGLTAAIDILVREFSQQAGIEVQSSLDTVDLPDATQLTVYRMVQESLTNIGKYAQASQVLVTVHKHPTHVAVQIRDNGSGFDPAGISRTAHGLVGMRQRVEAAGGRLTVSSRPGGGTVVSAVLPTPAAVAAPVM
ncbi:MULTISPECIES: CHASE3 domain-containing protein [unclassified Simplicispira]|uniref:CHASE3 domain-containing protein n=1 Tax=unclassified Simplicispira TaxID=2630407 RepID=UPI000D5E3D29|nr:MULTISPECIES: CHASE3 domain-containing protein [unclassified Simplicispira]PVY56680.1 signal transduction histidine kinase [Simplicispira sp. 125]REG17624.1 signal transduction histidine kinase [Simplicispira sp. 110]